MQRETQSSVMLFREETNLHHLPTQVTQPFQICCLIPKKIPPGNFCGFQLMPRLLLKKKIKIIKINKNPRDPFFPLGGYTLPLDQTRMYIHIVYFIISSFQSLLICLSCPITSLKQFSRWLIPTSFLLDLKNTFSSSFYLTFSAYI